MSDHPMHADTPHAARKLCGARTRSGEPCRQPAVRGRDRCRMHGGTSPVGAASGTFRHGLYSRYLPARLLATYRRSLRDDDALALREAIALMDARINDLLARVDTGEAGSLWRDLRAIYRTMEEANRARDTEGVRIALLTMGDLIRRGASDAALWSEIRSTLESRRKLIDTERRRLVDAQQMISAERALSLIVAFTEIVRTHVTDQTVLATIAADIGRLTGRDDGGTTLSRGALGPVTG